MRTAPDVLTNPKPGDVLAGPKLKIKVREVTFGEGRSLIKITATFGLQSSNEQHLWFKETRFFTPAQWSEFLQNAEVIHVAE